MKLKIEEMTLEQKIGMVLCVRRFQEEDLEFIFELLKKRAIGCIQFREHQDELNKKILDAADYPILVIGDAERGFPVSDLPKIPMASLAACNSPEACRALAKGIVRDAKAAGCNGVWGPVIDVLEGDEPLGVGRKFSDDPQKVGRFAAEIAGVYKQNHFLACGKHYPGTSGFGMDGHMSDEFCDFSKEYIVEHNLAPYKYLMEEGLLPTIMVGFTVCNNIDPEFPAALSKKVIDIIREMGFDGIAYTDSFAMMSVLQRFGEENIYGMAMAAGIDIILPNYRTSVRECYDLLMKNYKDGMFTEERLNEAVRRILAAQEFVSQKPENPTVFTEEDRVLLESVARNCITAITDEGVTAALTNENKEKLFVVLTQNGYVPDVEIPEITTEKWYDPERIQKRIRENFPESTIELIPEFSNWIDHEKVLNKATKFKEVVVITFCSSFCYQGTDGLTRRTEAWINSLQNAGKISAIVHFGNPFALKTVAHIPRRIFGFELCDAQTYAIDVLAGKMEAKGKLPFDIQFR